MGTNGDCIIDPQGKVSSTEQKIHYIYLSKKLEVYHGTKTSFAKISKWVSKIMYFNFEVRFKERKKNRAVDTLSR